MEREWCLAPGIIFWTNGDHGVIANLLDHTQFKCAAGIITFLQKKSPIISDKDRTFLEEKGIIEYFNDELFFKKIIEIKKSKPFDGIIYIEVTRRCNLRCLGCYNDSGMHNKGELTLEKAEEIANSIKKIGKPKIIITGGEPLVLRNWYEIIKVFSGSFSTEIFSNGTMITKEVARKLKEINVERFKISVDGAKAETHDKLRGIPGAFDRVLIGIKNLQEVGIPVTWQATICKSNFSELKEMINIAESLNVDSFKASPLRPIGRARDKNLELSEKEEMDLTKILEENKDKKIKVSSGESFCEINEKWRRVILTSNKLDDIEKSHLPYVRSSMCDVGIDRFLFNFNGELRLCPLFSSNNFNIEKDAVNVSNDLLYSNSISKSLQKPLTQMEACSSCGVKYLCKGSCRGEAFAYANNMEGCNIRQKEYYDYMLKEGVDKYVLQD